MHEAVAKIKTTWLSICNVPILMNVSKTVKDKSRLYIAITRIKFIQKLNNSLAFKKMKL